MITLADLVGIIMFESGQFIVGDKLESLGISTDKFWKFIVRNRLKFYQRYRPLTKEFHREAKYSTRYGAHIFFGSSGGNADDSAGEIADRKESERIARVSEYFDPRVGDVDPELVPKWVSSVIPTGTSNGTLTIDLIRQTRFQRLGEQDTILEPRKFYWKYEKTDSHGIIYLSEDGPMDIRAHYDYGLDIETDSSGVTDVEISGIDEAKDRLFIDLVLAKFLMMIGRSRRMFRMEGFPVEFDAGEVYSEGRELEEAATQSLYEQSNWYDAIQN